MLVITVHTKFRETMNSIFFARSFTRSVIIYRPNEFREGNVFISVWVRSGGGSGYPWSISFLGSMGMPCPSSGEGGVQGVGVSKGEGGYFQGGGYPPLPHWTWNQGGWVPLHYWHLVAATTHTVDKRSIRILLECFSCLSRYVLLPGSHKLEIRNFASKFQLKRSTLIHIGSTNTKQIWQGEQITHVK